MANKKSVSKVKLENTGERMIPEAHNNTLVYGEHISRYRAAMDIVKNKVVLDIASGSGYGSQMLADSATYVYGVDVSDAAIEYAKGQYSSKNLKYIVGSAERIPLEENSVDVVTTFETIEHVKDYDKFMSEIARVLKPDGIAIISTPNDPEFAEGNHFHLHEFVRDELLSLTHKYFKNTKEFFQASWLYTGVFDGKKISDSWESHFETLNLSPKPEDKCTYFYVLASNRKISETVNQIGVISEHWSGREYLLDMQRNHDRIIELEKTNQNLVESNNILNSENSLLKNRLSEPNISLRAHIKHYVKKKMKS